MNNKFFLFIYNYFSYFLINQKSLCSKNYCYNLNKNFVIKKENHFFKISVFYIKKTNFYINFKWKNTKLEKF